MLGIEAKKIYNSFLAYDDPFKYNFSTRISENTFKKDPSRWQWAKIERECKNRNELIKLIYPAFFYKVFCPKNRIGLKFFQEYYNKYNSEFIDKLENMLYGISPQDKYELIGIGENCIPKLYTLYKMEQTLSTYEVIIVFTLYEKELVSMNTDFPLWGELKEEMVKHSKFLQLYLKT